MCLWFEIKLSGSTLIKLYITPIISGERGERKKESERDEEEGRKKGRDINESLK